jgi:drug/metabolite transporter (DMT)-like permease
MSKLANLAAAGTVVLWASAFPAITVAVGGLGPAGLAVARLLVASAALAVLALAAALLRVRRPGRGAGRPALAVRRPARRDLPLIAVCGVAGMTGYQLLLNAGERVVPAGRRRC